MELTCPSCSYTWNYKGKMKHAVNCPDCRRSVKIPQQANDNANTNNTPPL